MAVVGQKAGKAQGLCLGLLQSVFRLFAGVVLPSCKAGWHRWQQQLFENGAVAFGPPAKGATTALQHKIAALEEKIQRKNEVLSELLEEYIKLKKALGDA